MSIVIDIAKLTGSDFGKKGKEGEGEDLRRAK
jgi:hypothetical protein